MQGNGNRDLSHLKFYQVQGIEKPPAIWAISNQTIGSLIRCRKPNLKPATRIAAVIRQELEAIFPLLDTVCQRTCPWCPNPCCLVAKVWYDFIDLIFLHLMALPLPPGPLTAKIDDPCRYLSHRGCRLPYLIRPWGCIQYTCATQRRNLHRYRPEDEIQLDGTLNKIRDRRYELEMAFNEAVVG